MEKKNPLVQLLGTYFRSRSYDSIYGNVNGSDGFVNTELAQLMTVKNGYSVPVRVRAISISYKEGLERAIIRIKQPNGDAIVSDVQINLIASCQTDPVLRSEIPVDFVHKNGTELSVELKSTVPVNADDIAVGFLGNKVKG